MTIKSSVHVEKNVDLAVYSSFGISSVARELVSVQSPEELLYILEYCSKKDIFFRIIGEGSNLVFPDKGVSELIIRVVGGEILTRNNSLVSDCGVLLNNLVERAIENNLIGVELLSGIPGTVGGAIVGNAGAYGRSISDVVDWVEIWDGEKIIKLSHGNCFFSYRNSIFKQKPFVILRVKITLIPNQKEDLRRVSKNIIKLRTEKYHLGIKCPGSFFKNIPLENIDKELLSKIDHEQIKGGKIPAGYLLEQVNARGMNIGDIQVADFHGNLLINLGKGKASEVCQLAGILKDKVYKKFGILLEEEVRYF